MGDLPAAVPMYEKSETHKFEVPRMLFDDVVMLESYVMKSNDLAIKRWWAQYMESTGEMETALHFYTMAKDYLSLVTYFFNMIIRMISVCTNYSETDSY